MTAVLEAHGLGKQYRDQWALVDCDLVVPAGRVVGLVGPNGAGKTTLLHLATGVIKPSQGTISVFGGKPADSAEQLARLGFVAQDTPTYANMSIRDHLKLGAHMNPRWDADFAEARISKLGLDPRRKTGKLSGGQRAQVALTMAVAKRPELLILDEPVAALDPLARREFLEALMEAVAEGGMSVVMSSHLVSDLELACDYLVLLANGRLVLSGDVDELLAGHRQLSGTSNTEPLPSGRDVVSARRVGRSASLVVRGTQPGYGAGWDVRSVDLEELVLAYMDRAAAGHSGPMESEVAR
jgi:ABC-2 type transport system ATP-binding protein